MKKFLLSVLIGSLICGSALAKNENQTAFDRLFDCVNKTLPIPKGISKENEIYFLAGACRQETLDYFAEHFYKQGLVAPMPFALSWKEFENEGSHRNVYSVIYTVKTTIDTVKEIQEKEKQKEKQKINKQTK